MFDLVCDVGTFAGKLVTSDQDWTCFTMCVATLSVPGGSCLGLWRFVWTRRSLKFLGLLNAILGPDGKTSLSFVGCAKIW